MALPLFPMTWTDKLFKPRPQLPTNFQPTPSLTNSLSPTTTSNQLPTYAKFDKLLDPAQPAPSYRTQRNSKFGKT